MQSITPLDVDAIVAAARETGAIVTAEEHLISGGMGSAVAEVLAERYPVPMEFVGIRNRHGESGTPQELLEKFGLTAPRIAEAAEKAIARKRGER
jgi:transketolase